MSDYACGGCQKRFDEEDLCQDLYCRDCHKSLSFEDCTSGEYVNSIRAQYGLPPMDSNPLPSVGDKP
jgi:predicted amidophosphoribosyltransferase